MGSRCPTGGRVANDGSLALILTTPTIPGHDGIHGVHALRSHAHFGRIFGRSPSAFANPNESFGWLRLSDTKETTILTSWHQTPSSRDNTLTRSPRWLRAFENFFLLSEACRTRTHRHQEIVVRGGGRERGKEEREVCYLCCFSINLLSDFFPFFRLLSDDAAHRRRTSFRNRRSFRLSLAGRGSIGTAFQFVRRSFLARR